MKTLSTKYERCLISGYLIVSKLIFGNFFKSQNRTIFGDNVLQVLLHYRHVEKKLKEYDTTDEISYSQLDSTDRTTLNTMTSSVTDFIELLVYLVDNLTKHSFIAKSQARYLKERKENLDEKTCIILLDFAENYHYIVQDEIQGYHWNKEQCKLHPVVMYFKDEENNLKCTYLLSIG